MHVMSPLRLQYGERSSQQREAYDIYVYIRFSCERTGTCKYVRKKAREDEGLLGILTGTHNRRWEGGEIEMRRARWGQKEMCLQAPPAHSTGGHLAVNGVSAAAALGQH